MKIQAGYTIAYDCVQPTPMLFMLSVHPSRRDDLLSPDVPAFDPPIPFRQYQDGFGNICTRLLAPPGLLTVSSAFVVNDSGQADRVVPEARQTPVEHLPDDAIIYLLGSRYCDTQALADIAWQHFGTTQPGWARVQAICDFVHNHIEFGYEHAHASRTASGGYSDRRGVCRDFAHLAVTFCRCMNIPARYCTGYLGDIGVPVMDAPMDFSAWFEAYLDGVCYTFDARHNRPRIGRILMARGRDATDVAISTEFGPAPLARFDVVTDEVR
jgi:transglutaminase-like putative cysteine protease